jgi:tRNA (guanine37-N1)-methyltransferase
MRFDVITLFPELVESLLKSGIPRRAEQSGAIELHCWNPRDYSKDKHRTVDDRPYGGGPGMLMKADCLLDSIAAIKQQTVSTAASKVIYLSPQGKSLDQTALAAMAQESSLTLLCGRYEGIDERVIELAVDEEWSIGDYVLSGGELGAMVLIDAISRLLPNVLGHQDSAAQDSFSEGLLDCPHYTRPAVVNDLAVPDVLTRGNHAEIAKWRKQQALGRTQQRRPDLLEKMKLSQEDQVLLAKYLEKVS